MENDQLIKLANNTMPFGRWKGMRLIDLPESYVVWYHSQGLPAGEIGELLGLLYEIKLNGLEYLVRPLRK